MNGAGRVVLHAGLHKTGTSAVQAHFAARREELARAGIDYPALGPGPGHHALAARWLRLPGRAGARYGPAEAEALWQALAEQVPGADRALLLSAEAFLRASPRQVDMAALRSALSRLGRPQIVVCLRGPVALTEALWAQAARDGPAPDPEAFAARARAGVAAGVPVCAGRVIDHLSGGFAPEEIALVPHEGARADLAGAILAAGGLPAGAAGPGAPAPRNRTGNALALWMARQLAPEAPPPRPGRLAALARALLRHAPVAARDGAAGRLSLFTPDEEEALLSALLPGLRRARASLCPGAPGWEESLARPAPAFLHRDSLRPRHWAIARAVLARSAADRPTP